MVGRPLEKSRAAPEVVFLPFLRAGVRVGNMQRLGKIVPARGPCQIDLVQFRVRLQRQELGFHGVVVTDSLSAPAAYVVPHPATSAIAAGDDLLLFGSEGSSEWNYSTLVSDSAKYPHLRLRLAQSAARVRALKAWLAVHGGPTCSGA